MLGAGKVRRGHQTPGAGFINGSELPSGCWESNLALLQKQHVFLTAEPLLRLLFCFCFIFTDMSFLEAGAC